MKISNRQYGAMRWTGEQWVGAQNVRFGRFVSTRCGISVNLPLSEVIIQK